MDEFVTVDNEAKLNFVKAKNPKEAKGHQRTRRRGKNLNRQNIALGDESMNISSLGNK